MADNDNIRVLYEDGLILGADELSGDQRYVRAWFERRSLTRDTPGVAYGLYLREAGGRISVTAGVAFGGDGKVIVVREDQSISALAEWDAIRTLFPADTQGNVAVYLEYQESIRQEGRGSYCGQSLDPRVVEDYRFFLARVPDNRHLQRLPPYENLAFDPLRRSYPVRIGLLTVKLTPATQTVEAKVVEVEETPCGSAALPKYPADTQYIGLVTASLTHPRRWNDDSIGREPQATVVLNPERGVKINEPLEVQSSLSLVSEDAPQETLHLKFGDSQPAPAVSTAPSSAFATFGVCESGVFFPIFTANTQQVAIRSRLLTALKGQFTELEADSLTTKSATVTAATTLQGTTTVDGGIAANGAAVFKGSATFNRELKLERDAADPATPRPSLRIDVNDPTFLTIDGAAEFKKAVTFGEDIIFQKNLTLSLPLVLASLSAAQATFGSLQVNGGMQVTQLLQAGGGVAWPAAAANPASLLNKAVKMAASGQVVLAAADASAVVGVVVGQAGGQALIVSFGKASVTVTGSVQPGDWLTSGASGALKADPGVAPGSRIAKAVGSGTDTVVDVIVSLS